MPLEACIVNPGVIEATSYCVGEQSGPGTVVRLRNRSGGTASNGDNRKPIGKISGWISAAETQRVLVDVNLRCHAGNVISHTRYISVSPNFIVIHLKYNFISPYGLYDWVV